MPQCTVLAHTNLRHLGLGLALAAAQIITGCATARLTQFHNFAQAGAAYVKATQVVLDEAGTTAIDTDSLVAQSGREGMRTADERRDFILNNNKELRKRLLLLRDIGRHGKLLQSYFETLGAVADPKAPSTLGDAAKGLYDSIGKLSPTIKSASLKGMKIEDQLPQATNFAVQAFKVKGLENELKARSQGIERELALQEAAFRVIANNLQTDLAVRLNLEETQEIVNPYATSAQLPRNWAQRREQVLSAQVAAQSAQSAADVAAKLRASFIALAENRLGEPSVTDMVTAINSMLDLTEKIRKASPSK